MTVFPELQDELVRAARRRHGRTPRAWRIARPVLVAAACAAAIAAIVLIARHDSAVDERPAPARPNPDAIESAYGVLRRSAVPADVLPDRRVFERDFLLKDETFDPARTRLAAQDGPWRVFVVPATLERRPALCTLVVADDRARRGACAVPGQPISAGPDVPAVSGGGVQGYMFDAADGLPGAVVAVAADGIEHVNLTFRDGTKQQVAVRDNVALYTLLDRVPRTITWSDPDGVEYSGNLNP